MTGAVIVYCNSSGKGERTLAKIVGLGWFKCGACGQILRLVEL